jgi:hypothetical protein
MGAGVLSTRQSRLQAAHEVTAARLRIRDHDERLLTLRAEIAGRVRPEAVRDLLAGRGDETLTPIAGRTRALAPVIEPGGDADEAGGGEALPEDLRLLLEELNAGGERVGR